MRENNWPPAGLDPNLPADHQGMNDPGNDEPEVMFDDDGEPIQGQFDEDNYDPNDDLN